MHAMGFTYDRAVDGMIKGGWGWLTKPAIFTWCGRYPFTSMQTDDVPHSATFMLNDNAFKKSVSI